MAKLTSETLKAMRAAAPVAVNFTKGIATGTEAIVRSTIDSGYINEADSIIAKGVTKLTEIVQDSTIPTQDRLFRVAELITNGSEKALERAESNNKITDSRLDTIRERNLQIADQIKAAREIMRKK